MKAAVLAGIGPPEVLEHRDVEKPAPRDNEMLIRVHASTATIGDAILRRMPRCLMGPMVTLMGFKLKKISGHELAGVVEAVGRDVRSFKKGDHVFGKRCPPETGIETGVRHAPPADPTRAHREAAKLPADAAHGRRSIAMKSETKPEPASPWHAGERRLQAARKAALFGVPTVLASGMMEGLLEKILRGEEVGTLFTSQVNKLTSRKHWIAFTLEPQGRIIVDEGAKKAILQKGKSLLPSGVLSAEGKFSQGDPVALSDLNGREFAKDDEEDCFSYCRYMQKKVLSKKFRTVILAYCFPSDNPQSLREGLH